DAATAAKIGKLLGVDAIILGSVTQFGRDDRNLSVKGTAIGDRLGRYGLGGIGRSNSKAVVALTARVVNVNTGEIISVGNGKGESSRGGTNLLGAGGGGGNYGSGGLDMRSSNFANTILGEAVNAAVTNLAANLNTGAATIPAAAPTPLNAVVADVSGKTLIINAGTKAGVRVGDKLQVSRVGREIRDPVSGNVIRRIADQLGELTITSVDESSAEGTFSGTGAVKVGDTVKN
ncbi:MAG TPA: CsgG/HfaB family protein, partial [Bryobacteraceae bacterium]|nr:CsgG/HfaB family protein [Bryobacteraceae bacterium]